MASLLFRFALDFMSRFSLQIDTMHYDQSPTSTLTVNDTMHCDILKYQKLVDMNQWNLWSDIMHFVDDMLDFVLI